MSQAPVMSLFDVVAPEEERPSVGTGETATVPPDDPDLVMWARQHLFEPVYAEAKAERQHVAEIQVDFLKRSFNALLSRADEALIAADEEVDNKVPGAEGRLRKAELVKEQHAHRFRQRVNEAERGRS